MPAPYSAEVYHAVFSREAFAPLFRVAPLAAPGEKSGAPRAEICLDCDCDDDPCLAITGLSEAEARVLADLAFEIYSDGVCVDVEGEQHTMAIFAARVTREHVLLLTFALDPFAEE